MTFFGHRIDASDVTIKISLSSMSAIREKRGGLMVSAPPPAQAVWVRVPAGDIVIRSCARHLTLSTQVYK